MFYSFYIYNTHILIVFVFYSGLLRLLLTNQQPVNNPLLSWKGVSQLQFIFQMDCELTLLSFTGPFQDLPCWVLVIVGTQQYP